MTFLNPKGLWLLLALPVLLILYFLRSHYEDRAIASTYIWKISSRFLKKRLPLQKFRQILLLILQILIVIAGALLIARPAIIDGNCKDYILILDCSASMSIQNEKGVTRFDRAIQEAEKLSEEVAYGHRISLIIAGNSPVVQMQCATNESEIKHQLGNLRCGNGSGDIAGAISMADELAGKLADPMVIVYTDRACEDKDTRNVHLVNCSATDSEWNFSVEALTFARQNDLDATVFDGIVRSKGENITVHLGLKIDGKLMDAKSVNCEDGEETTVRFTLPIRSFDTAELYTEVEDGFAEDNRYCVCQPNIRPRKLLLISKSPRYLENCLRSLELCELTVTKKTDPKTLSGYDIYIFDGIMPEEQPQDGSLVFIHPDTLPAGLVYGISSEEETALVPSAKIVSSVWKELTMQETVVKGFTTLVGSNAWEGVLSCNGMTVMSAKRQSNGLSTIVLGFDLHDTNLTLQSDFPVLLKGILSYSAPSMLEKNEFSMGETVSVALLPTAKALYLKMPDDSMKTLSTNTGTALLAPDMLGVYTVMQLTNDGNGEYADFYVHIPVEESRGDVIPSIQPVSNGDPNAESLGAARVEIWFWIALAMLVLLLAEWGVYFYEQI